MALVLADRVLETTTVAGTGAATLDGAITGYQPFSVIGDGSTTYYTIVAIDDNGVPTGDWEVGTGTYTLSGNTISRDTVLSSSNGGALVYFASGTKQIFLDLPSEELPTGGGTVTSVGGTGSVNGITLTGTVTSSGNLTLGGTLGSIANSQLTNSSITVNGNPISLGGSVATGTVTGVTATSPIASSGGTAPVISMPAATSSVDGYLTSANWTTFNGKANSGANSDITSIALTSGTITTAPSSSTDIVNKSYADSIASGVNFHAACQYATATALPANTYNNGSGGVGATLTATLNGALTVDGSTPAVNNRILVKNESAQANNGVYVVTQVGSLILPYILTRATDYDTSGSGTNEIDQGDMMLVLSGTVNANTSWVQQTALPITVGTTALVFLQFAAVQTYTAGTGLSLSTNQFSITNIGTSGTYGSSTSIPVITTNAQGQVTSVTTASNPQGTVTSVDLSMPSGFSVSGNPVTASGTLAVTTSLSGIVKGNGTGFTTATSGTDYAPATSGSSILYGNGAGGFSNVTIGSGLSFTTGTLSASGGSGTVTSVAALTLGTTGTDLSSTVANGTTTPVITLNVPTASAANRGALSSTDWSTFNGKQDTLVSTTNIKSINGASILGSGDLTVSGSFTGGTLTSPLIYAAGTSTNGTEPAKFQSGTVTTTPAAGTMEYDGVVLFSTPQSGNRGVAPSVHYITQVSAYTTPTGTANTLKQMFNVTTNGALTVAGNTTYFFDCLLYVTAMSATAGTLQFGIGGTATFTNILYTAIANKTATGVQTASSHTLGTAKTAVVITASNTTTTGYARVQGKFVVSTGGTIIPSFALSIAAAAQVQPGTYFQCWEAGTNTEVEIGAWS